MQRIIAPAIPVAARSKVWVCGRSLAGISNSNPTEDIDISLFQSVVFCQARICMTGRSFFQRRPTEFSVSELVLSWNFDDEETHAQ